MSRSRWVPRTLLGRDSAGVGILTTGNPNQSILTSNTITVLNTGTSTDTLALSVSGQGFTAGGAGATDTAVFSVSGTGSGNNTGSDSTTGYSAVDPNNGQFSTTIPITTVQSSNNGLTGTLGGTAYDFANLGDSNVLSFTNSGGTFSENQIFNITLGAGDTANITITTTVTAVPEPSTMAIAGLGALGMIGYGLRRRKALGA
jgi:hypothetical protein